MSWNPQSTGSPLPTVTLAALEMYDGTPSDPITLDLGTPAGSRSYLLWVQFNMTISIMGSGMTLDAISIDFGDRSNPFEIQGMSTLDIVGLGTTKAVATGTGGLGVGAAPAAPTEVTFTVNTTGVAPGHRLYGYATFFAIPSERWTS